MRAWAVVPVKGFARAKSRLEASLAPEERAELARSFCAHVLGVLATSRSIAGTLVVTDCAEVAAFARACGAEIARDGATAKLGAIVDGALELLVTRDVGAALVLMSDLPLLAEEDVDAMVDALEGSPMVLGPDRHEEGTNALGVVLPSMHTSFGNRGSFALHRDRALESGLSVAVHRALGVAWDVDSAEDLTLVSAYAERGARLSWKRKRSSRVSAA